MSGPFVRNPRLTLLVIGLLVVAGLGAMQALPRQEDPTLSRRFGVVTTFYPGATAQRVESLVTEKIEERLQELHEIAEIDSNSRAGVSVVVVELDEKYDEADVDEIWSKVRDRLADVAGILPPGASPPGFEDRTTTAVTLLPALVWEGEGEPPLGLLTRLASELENRLRNVPNTKETELFGEAEEEIRVSVDPAALASVGLRAVDVSNAIANADSKLPAGRLRGSGSDLLVEVEGELDSLERIREIPVRQQADGRALRVGDLARVEKTVRDPAATETWIGGRRAVAIAVTMESHHRVDVWAERASRVIEEFRSEVPRGIALEMVFDQSRYTEARLSNLGWNLVGSAAIVVVVLFFMMGVRSALIVAASLPIVFCAVLAELHFLGYPLHQMSVTGLIVAIGILIDNAIIAVDEFNAGLHRGLDPVSSALDSSRRLAVPLSASTLTTALAFLPIFLMPGGAGEFVGTIALGVILSVTTSLLLALTVVPAVAAFFAPRPEDRSLHDWRHSGFSNERLTAGYVRALRASFRRPAIGITAALALPVLGFAAGRTLPEQFFPANDRDQFQVQLVLPPQASIEETRRAVLRAREVIARREGVIDSHWVLGEGAPRVFYNMLANQDGVPSYAGGFVTTRSADTTEAILPALQADLIRELPEARVVALPFEQGPPFDAPIEARIVGPDLEVLRRLGDEVRAVLASTQAVTFTAAKLTGGEPKLALVTDEAAARVAGLRLADIARELDGRLEGSVGGSLLEANEEIPVRVRVEGAERATPERIVSGRVLAAGAAPTAGGRELAGVPLSAVARVDLVPELAGISRRNGERVNTVQGYLVPYALISESLADFRTRLDAAAIALPAGYRIEFGGESEQRNEALAHLFAFALPLFVVMAGSIVLSFNSFRMAGIIFAVAGLSVGLGQLGIWLFGYPMGFVAIVGTMGLVGVAINDSIMVLSGLRADPRALAADVEGPLDVVLHATRHVLATTFTTVGGFVPLIISGGRFWPPMAVSIAVGVLGATLVAILFVPAVHVWLQRRSSRRSEHRAAAPAGAAAAAAQ
jgi:multidrug efflux pump subunit AcrB